MATVEAPCVTGVSVKTKTATKTKSPESGQPVLGFTTKSRMKNVKVGNGAVQRSVNRAVVCYVTKTCFNESFQTWEWLTL